jgi:hypothetical protein
VTHKNIFPLSELLGIFPPTPPISTPNLYVAVGSSSLAEDPLCRLSFLNKACADVGPPPAFPSVLLFSLTSPPPFCWLLSCEKLLPGATETPLGLWENKSESENYDMKNGIALGLDHWSTNPFLEFSFLCTFFLANNCSVLYHFWYGFGHSPTSSTLTSIPPTLRNFPGKVIHSPSVKHKWLSHLHCNISKINIIITQFYSS